MMDLDTPAKRTEAAREKALTAAVRRFSTQAYEQVGLRHIATDSGLDVARVHRLFGSKEQLFAESVRRAFGDWPSDVTTAPALVETLIAHLLAPEDRPEGDPVLLLVRSVSDPHAAPILRAHLEERFLRPMAEIARQGEGSGGTADSADQQAALLAACCLGIAMLRAVMGVSALAAPVDPALTGRITHLLQSCLAAGANERAATVPPSATPGMDVPVTGAAPALVGAMGAQA
ncbi:TetR family transcriptional regulator [Azorhizobium sp. AG788]|uniref:TetR/AcrR family transcriptional regulator n=1 Tax=Azorhizobium sp. AG788 TaxID=2183897 RepID=UPI00313996FC